MPTLNRPAPALVLGLICGIVIALSPSCSSSTGGTGGGSGGAGGGSGGGSGGGTGGAGGGASVNSFCTDFSTAYCDYGIRCGQVAASAKSDCLSYLGAQFCSGAGAVIKGYQLFDATNAQLCVNALTAATCDFSGGPLFNGGPCDKVSAPNATTNGACYSSADCKSASEGCGGGNCAKTCQVAGALGKPCPREGSCATGLRCDSPTQTCLPPGTVGSSCDYGYNECDATSYCDTTLTFKCVALPTAGQTCRTSSPQCTNGYYCNANTCQARLAQGVSCTSSGSCQDALFCDFARTPDSCQPRLAAGTACQAFGDQCRAGLGCINGFCAAPGGAGAACTGYGDCAAPLDCDSVLRSCQARVNDLTTGQTCTADTRRCLGTLRCQGYAINPSGGTGTVGMCAVPKAGDACTTRYAFECPDRAFCNLAVDGGPGTCVAASSGSPCSFNSMCLSTDSCQGGLCAARKAAGSTCTSSSDCVSPMSCIASASGARTCGPLGDVGMACTGTQCLFPLECASGFCRHAGGLGERCLSGRNCFAGRCDTDAGICGAPGANGSACRYISDCVSGRCSDGKCEATCP